MWRQEVPISFAVLVLLSWSKSCFSTSVYQVERCYYFLHAFVETAFRNEPVDGRLVQFLLSNPTNDGGQWDMLVNLIGKCDTPAPIFSLTSFILCPPYSLLPFRVTRQIFTREACPATLVIIILLLPQCSQFRGPRQPPILPITRTDPELTQPHTGTSFYSCMYILVYSFACFHFYREVWRYSKEVLPGVSQLGGITEDE